jgi:hypothetical protein
MLTLNQIIAQIQALAAAHLQIASSGVGTIAEWQANPDRTYPLLWVFHERTDVTDSAIVHRVRLIAADRVKVGESGEDNIGHEQEVLSDMLSVLLDFIAYFAQQHGQSYIVERSGSIEPFTERGNDRVAGVSYVLNVRQPIDFSKCQIPQTGATIPPSVDGLTLYDFCDPAVIARLTPAQVACLEAEYGTTCDPVTLDINGTNVGSESSGGGFNINVTLDGSQAGSWDGVDTWEVTSDPCDPATITINGDPYGTVASGATEDISVLSDVGNPVGSLVSGNWEVGNAHLRVNGTTVGNLEPEQTHDHYATINGTQAGSWHNPSQTWRMNVLQGGSPVGSLSGTDWIVAPCANGSAVLKNTVPTTLSTTPVPSGGTVNITAPNATAVLKDTAGVTLSTTAIPSNVSANITAPDGTVTLNGSAYGSVKSGGSLNVVSPIPSLAASPSTATPAYGASVTITATPTSITPSSYTFTYQTDSIGSFTRVTQAGNTLAITAKGYGAQTVTVTATDGSTTVGATCTITVAQMTQVTDFVTNTGISDATIISAVRTAALAMDDKGLWSLMRAFYPFVGGTASTHKYNLKDPRDLDAAYRMVFAGGWTHNSNGITGNGVNTSGDSKLANNVLGQNSVCIGVYNRTAGTGQFDWTGSVTPRTMFLIKFTTGNAFYDINNAANAAIMAAPASEVGCVMANRNTSEFTSVNYRGQTRGTTAVTTSAPAATNLLLGAYTGGGGNSARNYAAAWICDGLTQQQQTDLVNIVNEFQTTLGRNV